MDAVKVKGMDNIPEAVVDCFRKEYPYAGDHLEIGADPDRIVKLHRMLLRAFHDGYLTAKQEGVK